MVCLVDGDNPSNAHLDDTACEHSCVLAVVSHVDRRQSERALEPAKLAPEDRSQILAHGEVWPEREVLKHESQLALVRRHERGGAGGLIAHEDESDLGLAVDRFEVSRLIRTRGLSCDLCALP